MVSVNHCHASGKWVERNHLRLLFWQAQVVWHADVTAHCQLSNLDRVRLSIVMISELTILRFQLAPDMCGFV